MSAIEYFPMEGVPGRYFQCPAYGTTMSDSFCGRSYQDAKRQAEPRHPACRGCAVGALHAGDKAPPPASMLGRLLCCRCHRSTRRLLHGALCISCYNRELEVIKGRNAKGRPPVHAIPTHHQTLLIIGLAGPKLVNFDRVADVLEAMLRVLRTEQQQVTFHRPLRPPPRRQRVIFDAPLRAA